ncbi:amino acid-binding protein [Luteococcus sp. OSA5]|uniref:amino acid-binding protein n=1 Tax=Luteococcus sp. OSA5 TaxID=3401630 RepID=UPI003B42B36F
MHLLRIQLPDRPGALGVVATAMGTQEADIAAIKIVEKGDGWVIDDFLLSVAPGGLIESIVGACNELPGVSVLWVSRTPEAWGLAGDVKALDRMLADPQQAAQTLVEEAPRVFHSQWAAMLDRTDARVVLGSTRAPDVDTVVAALMPLDQARHEELPADWLPHWRETMVAICPVDEQRSIVLGRSGGPEFLPSELRRLQHLVALGIPGATQPHA